MIPKRNNERWDIRITGEYDTLGHTRKVKIVFLDISFDGFKAFVEDSELKPGDERNIEVRLLNAPAVKIKARATWKSGDGVYGFQVIDSSEDWTKLVETQAKVLYKIAS